MKINKISDMNAKTKTDIVTFLTGKIDEYKYQLLQEVIAQDEDGDDLIDSRPASEFMDIIDKIHILETMVLDIIGEHVATNFIAAMSEAGDNCEDLSEEVWNE